MRAQAMVASAALLICSIVPAEESASAPVTETASATETAPLKVAVPDMRASGVDEDLASTLTDVITVESNKLDGVSAIGVADIEAMLGFEQKKQLVGCDDVTCMAEIGGALGVNAIVSSKLGKIGDTYILTVRVIDTAEVMVIGSTQETVEGRPDALVAASRRAVVAVLTPLARGAEVASGQGDGAERPSETTVVAGEGEQGDGGQSGGVGWPAWALLGAGALTTIVGVGGVGLAAVIFTGQQDMTTQIGDVNYWPRGSNGPIDSAQILSTGGLVAIGVGLALAAGGGAWLLLGGGADEEVPR